MKQKMQLDVGVSPPADIIKIKYHLIPKIVSNKEKQVDKHFQPI